MSGNTWQDSGRSMSRRVYSLAFLHTCFTKQCVVHNNQPTFSYCQYEYTYFYPSISRRFYNDYRNRFLFLDILFVIRMVFRLLVQ